MSGRAGVTVPPKPGTSQRGHREVWYADGLRFGCQRCGGCCGGAPGYVWVEDEDIGRMAAYLGMSVSSFWAEHCRRVWWRVSLREREGGDCVLLGGDGCRVYAVRPRQCRAFPFWGDVISKPSRWDELKERCPGVGRGRLYSREEIDAIAAGGSTG